MDKEIFIIIKPWLHNTHDEAEEKVLTIKAGWQTVWVTQHSLQNLTNSLWFTQSF